MALNVLDGNTQPAVMATEEVGGEHRRVFVNAENYDVSKGRLFQYVNQSTVSSGNTHSFIVTVGSVPIGAQFSVSADEKVNAAIYEASTVSGGTDVTASIYDRNRHTNNTQALVTITENPTITANGTLLEGGFADKFGSAESQGKLVLAANSTYLILIEFAKINADFYCGLIFAAES